MFKRFTLSLIVVLTAAVPLLAADDSNKTELLCAVTHTVECGNDRECLEGRAVDIYIPTFLEIELEKREIASTDEDRKEEITSIDTMKQVGDRLILTGIDGNRGWTTVISINTGEMTMTIADPDLVFGLFGECTAP